MMKMKFLYRSFVFNECFEEFKDNFVTSILFILNTINIFAHCAYLTKVQLEWD